MAQHDAQIIAVVGATGLQGRAVTRRLLREHWPVRALTRNPDGKQAVGRAGSDRYLQGAPDDLAAFRVPVHPPGCRGLRDGP
jgi:uncharacterized protein YbjT (DUF2867 family)